MSGRPWLVTGADGQLGRSLREVLPDHGIKPAACAHAVLDVCDAGAVARALDELRPEVVLNAAAFTHVDRCETERETAWRVNAEAPGALARACAGRALLVHLSTEYVFSGEDPRPIPEDAPASPRSVYGETKAAGERAVRESGCDHLIVRTQWLFGPGRNFVRTILAAGRRGEPLRVVEDQLGRPTATPALAVGLFQAVDAGLRGTLHLACEGIASWYDFAREIIALGAPRGLTEPVPVEPVATPAFPRPAARPAYGVLALERARSCHVSLPHWRGELERFIEREAESHA